MLGAGLRTLRLQRPNAPRGQRDLTSSLCRAPIRAPRARLHPASWQDTRPGARPSPRARAPQGRAPERRGPARRGGSGWEDPGLSGWAGRRAFFPQRAGGAGRGAGRAREERGEELELRRRPRQTSAPAARLLSTGPSAAENTHGDLHGLGRRAGGSSRGLGLRDHGGQGGRRRRPGVPR